MSTIEESRLPGRSAALPSVGPLSELVAGLLASDPEESSPFAADLVVSATQLAAEVSDPLADDDLQLALYLCFELHYRGFEAVDPGWEWNPALLAVRAVLEEEFMAALRRELGPGDGVAPETVGDRLFRLEREDEGVSLSRYLETEGGLEEFREFVVHRSLYQLKEADPHSWAIPRLRGRSKTALLE